jgi:sugar lactone lactonase YvrE
MQLRPRDPTTHQEERMNIRMRTALAAIAALTLTAAGPVALAQASGNDNHGRPDAKVTKVFTLDPSTSGNNPEGVAWDPRSESFFVGTVGTGTIYRATLRDTKLHPFITPDPADPPDSSVGMKVSGGKLFVAGGTTGSIYVYRIKTGALLARFETGAGGFLNDLVVTRRGDVYVTDSFRPTLWHVTAEQVAAGSGTPQALDVSAIPYEGAGAFNLNGIVAKGGRKLVVVDSNSGKLFRIRLGDDGASIEEIDEIEGATVPGGDGMLLDRGRLVVVQGAPTNQLSFLKLRRGTRSARLERTQKSDKLRGPSTVDRAKGLYLVVNADFGTSTKPFTVAGLPRKSKHGHHHGHGHRKP